MNKHVTKHIKHLSNPIKNTYSPQTGAKLKQTMTPQRTEATLLKLCRTQTTPSSGSMSAVLLENTSANMCLGISEPRTRRV